jgi:hypothetical protein
MIRTATVVFGIILLSSIGLVSQASAQAVDAPTRFIQVANSYSLAANITYLRAGGFDLAPPADRRPR